MYRWRPLGADMSPRAPCGACVNMVPITRFDSPSILIRRMVLDESYPRHSQWQPCEQVKLLFARRDRLNGIAGRSGPSASQHPGDRGDGIPVARGDRDPKDPVERAEVADLGIKGKPACQFGAE